MRRRPRIPRIGAWLAALILTSTATLAGSGPVPDAYAAGAGQHTAVTATHSAAAVEKLVNGGFETGDDSGWTVEYLSGAASGPRNSNGVSRDNAQAGSYGFNFWDDNNVTDAKVTQTLKDAPAGKYTFTGFGEGDVGSGEATALVSGADINWTGTFTLAGGGKWDQQTHSFTWPGGDMTVGFRAAMAKKGGWMAFDSFSLTYTAPQVTEMKLEKVTRTEYRIGEAFDPSTVQAEKIYDDGTSAAVTPEELVITGYDAHREGEQTVTATLKGTDVSVSFQVTVLAGEDQRVESLRVLEPILDGSNTTEPLKVRQGDPLCLRLSGFDKAGNERLVDPAEYAVEGFDPAKVGTQQVTVTMKTAPNANLTVPVEVVSRYNLELTGEYAVKSLAESSGDGVVTVADGGVVVDLSKVPAGNGTLRVEKSALPTNVTHLEFSTTPQALAQGVHTVVIEDWAVAQQRKTSLQSVVFPEELHRLEIGQSAFFQYSAGASTTLATLQLPARVDELAVGAHAFRQDARMDTPLTSVIFPAVAQKVTMGEEAFRQKFGRNGGLAQVSLPDTVTELSIGDGAFSVNPSSRAKVPHRVISTHFADGGAPQVAVIAPNVAASGSPNPGGTVTWLTNGDATTLGALLPDVQADAATKAIELKAGKGMRFEGACGGTNIPLRAEGVPDPVVMAPVAVCCQRPGFEFAGWAPQAEASEPIVKPGEAVPAEMLNAGVAYPVWKALPAKVTYVVEGAQAPDTVEGHTLNEFTVAALPADAPAGKKLASWNTAADGSGLAYEPGTVRLITAGGLTLYAQWEEAPGPVDPTQPPVDPTQPPVDPSPTATPTTPEPTGGPTESPTVAPTEEPTEIPTESPTAAPTEEPTAPQPSDPGSNPPTPSPTASRPGGPIPGLPITGTESGILLVLGIGLVAAGVAIRRRSQAL